MALIDSVLLFNKAYDMARPVEYYLDCNERVIALSDLAKLLDNIPTIEPERKAGKWIKISPAGIYECSVCGQNVMTNDIAAYRWCHGCGADMREGEQDGQT